MQQLSTAADLAVRINNYWGARVVRTEMIEGYGSVLVPITKPWKGGYPPEIENPHIVVASHSWPPPGVVKRK